MSVSLQLYSMRSCPDQIALLGALPAMGITCVEGFGGVYGDPKAYRAAMDASGVSMPSGHMSIADIEVAFDDTLQIARTLGMSKVFAPYLPPDMRPDTTSGYVDLARRLQVAGQRYGEHGISFGWHNHDFEFVALADGSIPMEVLLAEAPDITWEADLAWIVRGGRNPLDYIQRFGSRIAAVHVKDIASDGTNTDEDGWADLGAGVLDWAGLLQACRDQCSDAIYILEHDKPADPLAYASTSGAAFQTLWGGTHD